MSCPPQPGGLSFSGGPLKRFTMLIRIQNEQNVDAYTNLDEATGGMARRIRAHDIFLVNTRFQDRLDDSSPQTQALLVDRLRTVFPCNRIIALNGQGSDPTRPGYVYALADRYMHALMLDWEPDDWNAARGLNPEMEPWSWRFGPSVKRIRVWSGSIRGALSAIPEAAQTRVGIAPTNLNGWDYGKLAQTIDISNRSLGGRHVAPQSVQTQESCMFGVKPFSHRLKALFRQYRFKTVRRKRHRGGKVRKVKVRKRLRKPAKPNLANLSVQISFSETPSPSDPLPVRNVSVGSAANCIATGLHRGAGAFLFWATEDSMRSLLAQPLLQYLRPAV